MNAQLLTSGKWLAEYGKPAEYQSPLRVDLCYPSVVSYKDALSGTPLGVVSRGTDGQWFLSTVYNIAAIKVESKIEGFLLLSHLHKQGTL